jgi:ABC-type Zn uptake system ZnuABC Zn-binding protein ZnuA
VCHEVKVEVRLDRTGSRGGTKLNVVSTVSPVTNIVYNIGGDRINLTGIVPEAVNSHTCAACSSATMRLRSCERAHISSQSDARRRECICVLLA